MKTLKQLREMAKSIGNSSFSGLEHYGKEGRKKNFNSTKDMDVHTHLTNMLKLHHRPDSYRTHYFTNDHAAGETLHKSTITKLKSQSYSVPFDHEVQHDVDRVKSNDVLPKGHATTVTYNHFKKSKFPLVSSGQQFRKGHEMWHRLVHKALDDKHHVYHWDGNKLHPTTKENAEDHLHKSFGVDDSFLHKHMIISKKKLD
jgi:hypothetical protein